MIARASPKEMAPAGKQGAISFMMVDTSEAYPSRIATASIEPSHG